MGAAISQLVDMAIRQPQLILVAVIRTKGGADATRRPREKDTFHQWFSDPTVLYDKMTG